MGMKHFNIQMAAQISGLSTHTIRAWEKRYQALTPKRSESGRRQYSGEDIERLTLLSQLTNMGNSIGQIANLPDQELQDILDKLTKSRNQVLASTPKPKKIEPIDLEQCRSNLFLALANYKVDIISHELEKAKRALSPQDFALKVFVPVFTDLEKRQREQDLSDAQVSALYAILKFHAGNIIYGHYENGMKTTSKIAIATPEGEDYVFDILTAALLCCHHNANFFYLSSDLPAPSISEAANAVEADVVILGARHLERMKKPLAEYIEDMSFGLKRKMEIWIVGTTSEEIKQFGKTGNMKVFDTFEELNSTLREFS